MNLNAENRYLDQAEEALPSASDGRHQSETSFLQRLLRELGGHVSAAGLSPAELFRAVLYDQPLMHNARDVLEVLARPSRRPEGALRPGDWILRAVPGTGDVGHVSVLASADLLTPSELESEGIAAESQQPGRYGLVIEAGAFPHSRSRRFARRVLDSRGCVPPHTVILRPQYPQAGAMADLPPDEPEWTQRTVYIQAPEQLQQFDVEEPAPEEEGATQALSVLVVDELVQPLVDCDYAIYQGERSERGRFAQGGKGLAAFKTIDPTQPFRFEVRDRVCAIYSGAFIDPDDPAIEYGGTWFDWTLVRDNHKEADTSFWPHYRRAREQALHSKGSPRGVDSFWQHEHIVRRPIRAIESAGGRQQVTIQAIPAQIRTGPLVRYTDQQRASIWLEPTTPSMVKLRVKRAGGREAEKTAYASTVRVGGRHFAIVEVDGLHPDTFYQYTLDLAPLPAKGAIPVDPGDFGSVFPEITPAVRQAMRQQLDEASVEPKQPNKASDELIGWLSFRTLRASYDNSLRFATGSCRWYPGDVIEEDGKKKSWEPDMLDRLGEWLRKTPRPQWPHFQFYGGDQIYADEIGEAHHAELIRARFASRVPGPQDTSASVADRLVDGAWAGRFAHRLKPLTPLTGPAGDVSNNVTSGLKELATLYREHPVLRLIANGRVTEKQLRAQYETRLTRRHDVQGATREAADEREAREAINALPRLKQLLVAVEPYRVYVPYWNQRQRAGVANPSAYRYRSCNFLLWKLPEAETDLPTLEDQTRGDRGVRGQGDRGHPSADGGRHVADFAEYAFLYERAWTTSPNVRALLGNVPAFLMLDDHEVTDDWNFDASWVRMIHSQLDHYRMWPKTITDALCAYWIYQGLGNKARSDWQRERDPRAEVLDRAQRAGIDALPELRKCIYRAVMAESPADAKATFQTGLSLNWHYSLPFEPPFLVPDCRTRKCLVPKDEAMKLIDHERDPPQSETIDAEQIKWLRKALVGCKAPVAFIAPSTPLLMQKAVLKIMSQPESYARAWLRNIEGETVVGLALALLTGSSSLDVIRSFRIVKDLELMIRDKSWRDLWGLVEMMHRKPSPVKTLVLVSGDVHHTYCMTGNLSGRGRPFPELLQITSSGLKTTIRRDTEKAIAEASSDRSFDFAQHHLVPGFMSKAGSRRRELVLYKNAVAIVDVRLGAEVDVRVTHLAGEDEKKVDEYVYEYTSGPSYMKMGEPANTPYRLGAPAEADEGWSAGFAESRAVIDEAALDWQEDEPIAKEDSSLDEAGIGFPFDLHPEDPQDTELRDALVEQAPQARSRTVFDDESDEYDLQDSESVEAKQSIHEDEADALADEAEQWIPGDDIIAEDVVKATVSIASIQFAFFGNTDVHAMYLAANSHPLLPSVSLDWWARGAKITDPEWINGRSDKDNKCAVVTRNKPVRMRVNLKCSTSVDVSGTLTATPTLDGSTKYLKDASVAFTYPSGAASHTVDIELASTMPDEVGRFLLKVKWTATGAGVSFSTITTKHCLYAAYGRPLEPDYDSASTADTGVFTSVADGTLTGTRKRLDKLTELLGSTRRMPVKTANDLIELLWNLHVGINDTPGAPPYFDAGHDRFLTVDGERNGAKIPIDDQWLAWLLTKSPHWNDASCIGHVQLLKTMAAAIGIFVRRTWVYPTTKILPDKSTPTIADTDCYSLGTFDSSKTQKWTFTHSSGTYVAVPKLMEPDLAWENFEACMLTSQGRFLTGGYATSSNPKSFTTDRGFKSAKDLLRWWCNTKRPSFGKRFMAWVYYNDLTGEAHFWDVDGKRYAPSDYVKIRDAGKELPPP